MAARCAARGAATRRPARPRRRPGRRRARRRRVGPARVVRAGEAEVLRLSPPPSLPSGINGAPPADAYRGLLLGQDVRWAVSVPLSVHGRLMGVLTFLSTAADRDYGRRRGTGRGGWPAASRCRSSARLYAEAQEASRLKDEFLAVVSHELHAAERDPGVGLPDEGRAARRRVVRPRDGGRRAATRGRGARIIDDVLDVSRIIRGHLKITPRATTLAPLIDAALDAVRPAAEAKGVRLEFTGVSNAIAVGADAGARARAAHRRRPRPPAAGRVEPVDQRGEVHARGRPRRHPRVPRPAARWRSR